MARIRTLKPEHRTHRKVGRLTDREYRLWVGMICEADDEGRLVADVDQLRLLIFGYQPTVKNSQVRLALENLASIGLVKLYEASGALYACFPDWRHHQRIDRPRRSNLPSIKDSTNPRRMIDESSTIDRRGSEGSKGSKGSRSSRAVDNSWTVDNSRTISHEIGVGSTKAKAGAKPSAPRPGTYAAIEKTMRAQHPGVSDAELGGLVMQHYQALLARSHETPP